MSTDGTRTSQTLLERLRDPRDHQAWQLFVRTYGPRILNWCRRAFPDQDAEDVAQEVLLRMHKYFPSFTYNSGGSFRGYLRRVTQHAVIDAQNRFRKQAAAAGGTTAHHNIEQLPDSHPSLEDELDQQAQAELIRRASEAVCDTEEKQVMYRECILGERPATEVAAEMGKSHTAIHVALHRLRKKLKTEIERLDLGGIP
jgi:RNA polymerase sigma-70 factor (ECF subfamily)